MNKRKTYLFDVKSPTWIAITVCLALFVTVIHGCKHSDETLPSDKKAKRERFQAGMRLNTLLCRRDLESALLFIDTLHTHIPATLNSTSAKDGIPDEKWQRQGTLLFHEGCGYIRFVDSGKKGFRRPDKPCFYHSNFRWKKGVQPKPGRNPTYIKKSSWFTRHWRDLEESHL